MAISYFNPSSDPNVQSKLNYFRQSTTPTAIQPQDAQNRALQYNTIFGVDQSSANQQIIAGQEPNLRDNAASQVNLQANQANQTHMNEMLADPTQYDASIMGATIFFDKKANPENVLEEQYANKMFSDIFETNSPLYDQASKENINIVDAIGTAFQDEIAKQQVVYNRVQDLGIQVANTNTLAKGLDFLTTLIPFRSWLDIQDAIKQSNPNASFAFLGNNIQDAVSWLYNLPLDQFTSTFNTIITRINSLSPSDAQLFAQAFLSFSDQTRRSLNLQSALDIATAPGLGTVFKLGADVVKGVRAGRVEAGIVRAGVTADSLGAMSSADILRNSARTAASSITPTTVEAGVTSSSVADLKAATSDIASAAARNDPVEVLAAAGRTEDAASIQALRSAADDMSALDIEDLAPASAQQLTTLFENIPSFMNSYRVLTDFAKTNLTSEFARRLLLEMKKASATAGKAITDRQTLERLTPQASLVSIQAATTKILREFAHLNDGLVSISEIVTPEKALSNERVLGLDLELPNGTPFKTREQANYYAQKLYDLGSDYQVLTHGDGFRLRVLRTVDETPNSVLEALVNTGNSTPLNLKNIILNNDVVNKLRTADDLLPYLQRVNRGRLTSGTQELFRLYGEVAKPIRKLSIKSNRKLSRFISSMLKNDGVLPDTIGSLSERWQEIYNRLPTLKEASAFFSYKKISELNYVLNNLTVYGEKVRKGLSSITIKFQAGVSSPTFEGKLLNDLDLKNLKNRTNIAVQSEDGSVIVVKAHDVTNDQVKYYQTPGTEELPEPSGVTKSPTRNPKGKFIKGGGKVTSRTYKGPNGKFVNENEMQAIINQRNKGMQIIKINNPYSRPLKGTGNSEVIDYVITSRFTNDRLPYNQLEYNPKDDLIPSVDHYIKQPKTEVVGDRQIYHGDTVVAPAKSSKLGSEQAQAYEKARQLLKDNKLQEFKKHVNENLPVTPEELKKAFDTDVLSLEHPFLLTRNGDRTLSSSSMKHIKDNYEDADPTEINPDAKVPFSQDSPLFNVQLAKELDTMEMMSRAVSTTAKARYMNDYRIMAATHFVEEFNHLMKGDLKSLRDNPIGALYSRDIWNEKTNPAELAAGKAFQRATLDLMNVKTPSQRLAALVSEKLYDSIYNTLGEKAADIADHYFLWAIKDPLKHMRAAAFHLKLGFWNPVQLIKQASTLTITMSLAKSPVHALKAFPTWFLHRALMMSDESPAVLAKYASIASHFGWKEEHFIESYLALRKSGHMVVGGEHNWSADMMDPKLFSGKVSRFFDKSTFFFTEGERSHRIVGWNIAYQEWRSANPSAVLDRRANLDILRRANDLSVNMKRESNAAWQKGLATVPLQFYTYQARLWELVMGKRLTVAEKTRLLVVQSALFGLPIGLLGTILPVWPWYDDIKKGQLSSEGKSDPQGVDAFMQEGLTQVVGRLITGEDSNINQSLGPTGFSIFHDIATGASALDILFGVSGSTLGNIVEYSVPIMRDINNITHNGLNRGTSNLLVEDFTDALRTISTVNNAARTYFGLTYGQYITQGGAILDNTVNTPQSVMFSLLGTYPSEIDDIRWMSQITAGQHDAQNIAKDQIIKYYRRYLDATDPQVRQANLDQAEVWFVLGDFKPDEQSAIISQAVRNYESVFESVNRSFLTEDATASTQETRLRTFADEMDQQRQERTQQ